MLLAGLLIIHTVVLGYWLGAELVINAGYRLVCYAEDMPFAQRDRLMDHVMRVDQHVRYALVLQASLGLMLAAGYGYVPGGERLMISAGIFGLSWLAFIELVHRQRKRPAGHLLAQIDRWFRYLLLGVLLAVASSLLGDAWPLPAWLRWKLAAFAGVIACGVGIRLALLGHFKAWARMANGEVTQADNAVVQRIYLQATSVLAVLWVFLGFMAALSVFKPAMS
ncbi:MAG: hypothetical protein AAF552_06690 [Pseudomonadota bacterium]